MLKISIIGVVLTCLLICAMICVKTVCNKQEPGYALAFYMLDSEEAPITQQTPSLITKTFSEKNNLIIADYDPRLSVETKDSFFQTTFPRIMNHSELTPEGKNELWEVQTWIMASPKKIVGFQLIKK